MSFIDNEIFCGVITGEYSVLNGKCIAGAYTTKDDGALVVGINTFERLLDGVAYLDEMSVEDYVAEHEDAIRMILNQKDAITKVADRKKKLNKAVDASRSSRKNTREYKAALIMRMILDGFIAAEISERMCISAGYVSSTIKIYSHEAAFHYLLEIYKDTVFAGTASQRIDFKNCNYSYKEYKVFIKKKKEQELEEYNQGLAKAKELEQRMVEDGYKPIGLGVVEPPKEKVIDDDSIVDFDTVIAMMEKSEDTEQNGVSDIPYEPEVADDAMIAYIRKKNAEYYQEQEELRKRAESVSQLDEFDESVWRF